ncbi:MAG: hypothetical protein ACLFS3_02820 [Candidatus Aenigmatarchaeota archaeon]
MDLGVETHSSSRGPYLEPISDELVNATVVGSQRFPEDCSYQMALNKEKLKEVSDVELPAEASWKSYDDRNLLYEVGDLERDVLREFQEVYSEGGLILSEAVDPFYAQKMCDDGVCLNFARKRFEGNTDPEVKSAQLDRFRFEDLHR